MIHQVKISQKNARLLRQLVNLQVNLLSLAANETVLTVSSSQTGVGNVEMSLRGLYPNTQQAKKVADWITRTKRNNEQEYNELFKSLVNFAAHSDLKAKQQFVEGIRHDIELIDSPKKDRLLIAIERDAPTWQKEARNFLEGFYDVLGTESGFPEFLFDSLDDGKPFRRWDFIDNFTEANPNLRLCAVCDSTLYRTTIGDRPYTSIEHFFPKSRYPHLAIHPFNLIPICPHCNSGAAGAIDPFGEDNLGVLGLILPYQTSEQHRGLSEQTYIYIRPNNERDKHPFHLEILPNRHYPDAKTLIANFERIYKVQERWNSEMDWLDQHVFRRITQFLAGDVQSGNKLEDIRFLIDRFSLLMAIISKENLGQDPFGYATIWLIRYHIDTLQNSIQHPDNSPIYTALQEWAETQQVRWKAYRVHAEEVMDRVPKKQ